MGYSHYDSAMQNRPAWNAGKMAGTTLLSGHHPEERLNDEFDSGRPVEVGAPVTRDWDSDESSRGLRAAGRSALAWELLRRDPDYAVAAQASITVLPRAAPKGFVDRLGLHFREGFRPTL